MLVQAVKNPPPLQETRVRSLGQKDSLEESMAIHSSILAGKTPMNRGALQALVCGVTELDMPEATEHAH